MSAIEQHLLAHSSTTILGIDVGGTKLLIRAFSPSGVQQWRFPTGISATPAALSDPIESIRQTTGATIAGIAIPGLVHPDGTVIDSDVLPALNGWNPMRDLGLNAVRNDGDAALETVAWQAGPKSTVAVLGAGTAIAAAIQVGGERLRAHRPYATELGYVPFGTEGRIDDHAAGMFLAERLKLAPGSPEAQQAVAEAGRAFGIAILTVLHLIHPSHIGLYGGALRYAGYLEAALETVAAQGHPAMLPGCQIAVVEDPDHVVADGVALAALEAAQR